MGHGHKTSVPPCPSTPNFLPFPPSLLSSSSSSSSPSPPPPASPVFPRLRPATLFTTPFYVSQPSSQSSTTSTTSSSPLSASESLFNERVSRISTSTSTYTSLSRLIHFILFQSTMRFTTALFALAASASSALAHMEMIDRTSLFLTLILSLAS